MRFCERFPDDRPQVIDVRARPTPRGPGRFITEDRRESFNGFLEQDGDQRRLAAAAPPSNRIE
jgi:hypothetical protein